MQGFTGELSAVIGHVGNERSVGANRPGVEILESVLAELELIDLSKDGFLVGKSVALLFYFAESIGDIAAKPSLFLFL